MKAYIFPGQGSQTQGMGGSLFDEFQDLTAKADKILGYSIKELCLEDPRKELGQTQFTQPALYVVNALSYFKKFRETGEKPDYVLGHSLGEFNALMVAECFDFEAGLKLVKKRGELMSQVTDGAMAAILNATKEEIETILETNGLTNIDLVNYNTPSQIVISGLKDEIAQAQSHFQQGKILYYPLNTSGAFHSRFMQPAKEKFEAYLKKFKFSNLQIPVISNVTARPYRSDEVVDTLSAQIASPVNWSDSIQYLLGLSNGQRDQMEFEEIGYGDVLTKLVSKIKVETAGSADKRKGEVKADRLNDRTQEIAAAPVNAGVDPMKQVACETAHKEINVESRPAQNEDLQTKERETESNEESVKAMRGQQTDAHTRVEEWNRHYPIGTKVKCSYTGYEDLETRTEAVVLFGHRAAVYMKGYNGYFDLREIKAQ